MTASTQTQKPTRWRVGIFLLMIRYRFVILLRVVLFALHNRFGGIRQELTIQNLIHLFPRVVAVRLWSKNVGKGPAASIGQRCHGLHNPLVASVGPDAADEGAAGIE